MKQRPRIYCTETEEALMWDRWQKGESLTWDLGKRWRTINASVWIPITRCTSVTQETLGNVVRMRTRTVYCDSTSKRNGSLELPSKQTECRGQKTRRHPPPHVDRRHSVPMGYGGSKVMK